MNYGICNLSIVPLRIDPSDKSEMVSQVLFGEHFEILDLQNNWCNIRLHYDCYEGWIDVKQFVPTDKNTIDKLHENTPTYASEIIDFVTDENENFAAITMGSELPLFNHKKLFINELTYQYDGEVLQGVQPKSTLVDIAIRFLNTPYLWGGKTPFGIDCSGFTQLVYKLCGHQLMRDAAQQATQGEVLSFIEECVPGDLAFFDNDEGIITHVGIILKDNYIIHAHGKVRIDRIDHSGIFNADEQRHTHKLRVIKKIV
jgi:hypothetical protein